MRDFYFARWPRFLKVSRMVLVGSLMIAIIQLPAYAQGKEAPLKHSTVYRTIQIDGLSIFYREAGPKDAPTLLLLHGLPSSSRMFDPLIAQLSNRYHLIAPDYPGFGHSDWPDPKKFAYTFDHIAEIINHFTEALGLSRYTLHAGLRRTRRSSHGLGPFGSNRGAHCPERCGAQRRSRSHLENTPGLLGRSRR